MSIIRSDIHGLYLKSGGYLFRPILPTDSEYPSGTKHSAGIKVKAGHIGGSPYCRVGDKNDCEYWYSHGDYFDSSTQKHIKSELLLKKFN